MTDTRIALVTGATAGLGQGRRPVTGAPCAAAAAP